MRVLLLSPKIYGKSRIENCPPYGLAYLAAYIRKNSPYAHID